MSLNLSDIGHTTENNLQNSVQWFGWMSSLYPYAKSEKENENELPSWEWIKSIAHYKIYWCVCFKYCEWLNFCGVPIFLVFVEVQSMNSSTHEIVIFCMSIEGKYYGHEFRTLGMHIFLQSTKIGTHESKAIQRIWPCCFTLFTIIVKLNVKDYFSKKTTD